MEQNKQQKEKISSDPIDGSVALLISPEKTVKLRFNIGVFRRFGLMHKVPVHKLGDVVSENPVEAVRSLVICAADSKDSSITKEQTEEFVDTLTFDEFNTLSAAVIGALMPGNAISQEAEKLQVEQTMEETTVV